MRHSIALLTSVALAVFFVLLQIKLPSPTGAVAEEQHNVSLGLNQEVDNFFGTNGVLFPRGNCGDVISDFYSYYAFMPAMTEGFATEGADKVATINFMMDRVRYVGTMDLFKGQFLSAGDENAQIGVKMESITRIPKGSRRNFFDFNIYGITDGTFVVTRGTFSTPSLDCEFKTASGLAICNCQAHSIRDISGGKFPVALQSAGLPAAATFVNRDGTRWTQRND